MMGNIPWPNGRCCSLEARFDASWWAFSYSSVILHSSVPQDLLTALLLWGCSLYTDKLHVYSNAVICIFHNKQDKFSHKTLASETHPSLIILYIHKPMFFFPTITENQLLYPDTLEQKEVKPKPQCDRVSSVGNSDSALTGFYCPGLEGSLQRLWQPMGSASVYGEGWRALNPCCFQRKVELHPEVPTSSKGESLDNWVHSGKHHLSLLTEGEVKTSVIEVDVR